MGKKPSQSKHERKQHLNNMSLIKILKPKVYITDSSNFKKLVQELTGKVECSPVESSPPPPPRPLSPPTLWEDVLSFVDSDYHHHHEINGHDSSFDSSCFATPLEGSPDLSLPGSLNSCDLDKQKVEFFKDLEVMLMEMESNNCDYNACNYGMLQQDQICVYDYDLSTFYVN